MATTNTTFNLLSLSSFFIQLIILSSVGGFTVDLIHRDFPASPFYDPSATKTDRFKKAVRCSFTRACDFQKQTCLDRSRKTRNSIQTDIIQDCGPYLMKMSIGTPPFQLVAVADTGSDLIWTQCKPCKGCYKQKAPLFDPKQSSTYRALACHTSACHQAVIDDYSSGCNKEKNICEYGASYGDGSSSEGDLAVDTFTFGSSSGRAVSFPRKVFGCGHNNNGTFKGSASGIIGLGDGPLSMVRQLSSVTHGKFSYCLVDLESRSTSKIKFGEDAVVSGKGVVSTPIVKKNKGDYFYYLTLESISVGNKKLAYKTKLPFESESTSNGEKGNIIIDSGTFLTVLPAELYEAMEGELIKVINKENTSDPEGRLSLCYGEKSIDIPTLTFSFEGAKVVLPPSSTFIPIGDLLCLAMVPTNSNDYFAVFGNLSQMNFLIGYDLENSVLSFKPTDCAFEH